KNPAAVHVGDRVEVVGFPDLSRPSPLLREAAVRKIGSARLPSPQPLNDAQLVDARWDSRLVELSARLVSWRTNKTDQLLELADGGQICVARLPIRFGRLDPLPLGSWLQLTGVYSGQGGDRSSGRDVSSFEILLNSPEDMTVLQKPSWWTA